MSKFFTSEAYEAAFGVGIDSRFRRFLEEERLQYDGRLADLPTYRDPIEIYFDGQQLESFINEDWPDYDEDGNPYGHPTAVEIEFDDELEGWVPLATIGEEEVQILLCRAGHPDCPVAMWEHETNEAMPVAMTLDAFLERLAPPDEDEAE